jgi:hypothetical protein
MLVAVGAALVLLGAWLWLGPARERGGLLPGDIHIERGNFKLYFPIVTCLVLSILLTLLLRWFRR